MTAAPTPDKDEVLKALAYLLNPSDVVELRALHRGSRKRTDSGYFDSAHWPQLADAAIAANNEGAAAYITLNPCDPQLLSRYHNRLERFAVATTTDAQIIRRRWLPIDVDPVRPANTSATAAQLTSAAVKASAIRAFLIDQGWPACAAAKSGNGFHLLYAIDLPNDEVSKTLIEGVLKALASQFDDQRVKVDRSVFNAARIWKLYGTVANKGDHTEAAPWRLAVLEDQYMPPRVPVTVEQLRALAPPTERVRVPGRLDILPASRGGPFDLEDFITRHGLAHTKDVHDGSERFKLDACPFNPEHKNGEAAIFRRAGGALAFKCFHNSCADKDWRAVREHYDGPPAANGDLDDLAKKVSLAETAAILDAAVPPPRLRPVSVGDVLTNPSPAPECVWDGYLPRGVVSLWGAHGGTGKSTIALMLCVATVMGRELFGAPTQRSKVLFVSLEDNENIVRHRLAHICREWGVTPESLDGELLIVDGCEDPELFTAEAREDGGVTRTYVELQQIAAKSGAGLVVIDNASDAFGGDEIQRRQVRAFMRAMGTLAKQSNCAVVVLAHVDKATSRKTAQGGEGYSGSTAWHNSARSRLFMSRDDTGLLTLEHQKANLTQRRESITLEWPDGGLPRLLSDTATALGASDYKQGRADDDAAAELLRILVEFESRKQFASPKPTARNNVFALLKSEPLFQRLKLSRDRTARLVTQSHRAGWIESVEYKTNGKWCERWTVTQKGRLFAGIDTSTSLTSPSSNGEVHNEVGGCGFTHIAHIQGGAGGERAHGLAP